MKLMFASDIHGSASCCRKLLERFEIEKPDKLILLGRPALSRTQKTIFPRTMLPRKS